MANVSNKCASCKYITNSLQESPCMSCMPICGSVSHYESISGWQSGTSGNGGAGTVEICCSGSGEKKKKNEAEYSHPDWEANQMSHDCAYYEDGCKVGFNADKWISVRDRFPEEDGRYLVHIPEEWAYKVRILSFAKNLKKTGMYEFKHLKRRGWWGVDNEYGAYERKEVTHWMPLPEPPKGE